MFVILKLLYIFVETLKLKVMERMTLHRALSELKLIDSRIEKQITEIEPSGLMQVGKLVNNFYKKEDFESSAKSSLQSVNDLIDRKNKIKSAIVNANSLTKLVVAGKEMTIADAINYKSVIQFKKDLLKHLHEQHINVKSVFNRENEKINTTALDNAKIVLGRQGDDKVKPTDEDVKAIVDPFVKRNEWHIVDPLNVEDLIIKMRSEIQAFELDVDSALSEINAITFIEI